MSDRGAVLDQPWQIELYALSVTIKYLEMEVRHARGGLRMTSRAPKLSAIREKWGVEGRTKEQVLNNLVRLRQRKEEEADIIKLRQVWQGQTLRVQRWVWRTRESVARALAGANVPESAASLEGNLDIGDYISGLGFIDRRSAKEISAALVWLEQNGLAESMEFGKDDYDYSPHKHYVLTKMGDAYARVVTANPTERKA